MLPSSPIKPCIHGKKEKRIQLNDDLSLLSLSLSLCLSLSYTNLFQIGSNHMYCPRIRMWSHQREGGGGENPNSIFVGKYLIYLQSTLPISPGFSRSMSESAVHLLYLNCCLSSNIRLTVASTVHTSILIRWRFPWTRSGSGTQTPLRCHWLELNPVTRPNFKGSWESSPTIYPTNWAVSLGGQSIFSVICDISPLLLSSL